MYFNISILKWNYLTSNFPLIAIIQKYFYKVIDIKLIGGILYVYLYDNLFCL